MKADETIKSIDQNLVKRLSAGEDAAFTELYDSYGRKLYSTAYSLLSNRLEAEDAVQETFLALARYHKKLSGVTNLKAYLYSILRNNVNRIGRQRSRQQQTVSDFTAEQELNQQDKKSNALKHALDLLPLEQAEVIALKIAGGMTFSEIGETLDISINTAASRYRYALERLKSEYEVNK